MVGIACLQHLFCCLWFQQVEEGLPQFASDAISSETREGRKEGGKGKDRKEGRGRREEVRERRGEKEREEGGGEKKRGEGERRRREEGREHRRGGRSEREREKKEERARGREQGKRSAVNSCFVFDLQLVGMRMKPSQSRIQPESELCDLYRWWT